MSHFSKPVFNSDYFGAITCRTWRFAQWVHRAGHAPSEDDASHAGTLAQGALSEPLTVCRIFPIATLACVLHFNGKGVVVIGSAHIHPDQLGSGQAVLTTSK
jgi:hypothetical protein